MISNLGAIVAVVVMLIFFIIPFTELSNPFVFDIFPSALLGPFELSHFINWWFSFLVCLLVPVGIIEISTAKKHDSI